MYGMSFLVSYTLLPHVCLYLCTAAAHAELLGAAADTQLAADAAADQVAAQYSTGNYGYTQQPSQTQTQATASVGGPSQQQQQWDDDAGHYGSPGGAGGADMSNMHTALEDLRGDDDGGVGGGYDDNDDAGVHWGGMDPDDGDGGYGGYDGQQDDGEAAAPAASQQGAARVGAGGAVSQTQHQHQRDGRDDDDDEDQEGASNELANSLAWLVSGISSSAADAGLGVRKGGNAWAGGAFWRAKRRQPVRRTASTAAARRAK